MATVCCTCATVRSMLGPGHFGFQSLAQLKQGGPPCCDARPRIPAAADADGTEHLQPVDRRAAISPGCGPSGHRARSSAGASFPWRTHWPAALIYMHWSSLLLFLLIGQSLVPRLSFTPSWPPEASELLVALGFPATGAPLMIGLALLLHGLESRLAAELPTCPTAWRHHWPTPRGSVALLCCFSIRHWPSPSSDPPARSSGSTISASRS